MSIPPPPEPMVLPMTHHGGYIPTWIAEVRRDHNGRWVYRIRRNGSREVAVTVPLMTWTYRRGAARAARREAQRLNRIAERPDLTEWRRA